MHVGALVIFEGPPPSREDFCAHIESRLRSCRATGRSSPSRASRWAARSGSTTRASTSTTTSATPALPSPGSIAQLRQLVGRIFSQRLDRSKPLWEIWLVQGLEDGRFALISKTHHALVDGISGRGHLHRAVRPLAGAGRARAGEDGWSRRARAVAGPSSWPRASRGSLRTPGGLAGRAAGAVQRPGRAASDVREAAEGIGEVVWAGLNPAPDVPLNVPIGPHRRLWWVAAPARRLQGIKNALGGTVNDVFLAVVAGALRPLAARHAASAREGLELRGLVPVSIRAEDEHGALGNRIAAMRAPLPVYVRDPVERLRIVRESMQGLKESKQALGAEVIADLEGFAPPTLLAQASRAELLHAAVQPDRDQRPRTAVPALPARAARCWSCVPVAFLPENHALAVAIMSYNGRMEFGLLADYDAMPDLESLAGLFEESLEELLAAARDRAPAPAGP